MSKIYAIANQKGGVGKTTSCVNIAASLVAAKQKVLLIDLDPQGNATTGSGIEKSALEYSIYDVMVGEKTAAEVIEPSPSGKFDVIPANGDLTAAEVELLSLPNKEFRLRSVLEGLADQYDFVLIDCPPSLNMLTLNALTASNGVIIPMQCEYYALEGLSALMSTINQIQQALNPKLRVQGILRTMYDPRNSLTNDVSAQLTEYFGDKLYKTCIPRNVRLAEAPSFGQPALIYDRTSKGALAYLALAGEILRRERAAQSEVTVEAVVS